MIRYVPFLFLLALVCAAVIGLALASRTTKRTNTLAAKVDDVESLAWDHADLDPDLSRALLTRIRAYDQVSDLGNKEQALRALLGDLGDLAMSHRESAPAFSVIVTDTVRPNRALH